MTLRLVGLISIVLLLSLAAFGLLMGHYQDQVMQEVARTASEVGKATLRTLESSDSEPFEWVNQASWVTDENEIRIEGRSTAKGPGPGPVGGLGNGPNRSTIMVRRMQRTEDGKVLEEVITGELDASCDDEDGSPVPCGVPSFRCPEGMSEQRCSELSEKIQADLTRSGGHLEARLFVDLEEIRADRQSSGGDIVLQIPTMTSSPGDGSDPDSGMPGHTRILAPEHRNTFHLAHGDVIRLPIAVDDYDELFQSIRGRSLLLFLGVFVVGMVLSTGLASRFTKPIRRLDSGIRRLSGGDLDVRVDVQGKDEIARLGMAFNDMAHKLKESRDRSREMVRREKLSALGGLAAGVAHDVRNPLHSIGLTLQHLREACRPESEDRATEFDHSMDIIRGEIRRLDQLVTSFLRFSRSEPRDRQPVDLADLLQETARLIQKEAEWRGIDVRLDLNAAAPAVSADGESLRASILNLVLNSFNAMPEGGRLDLALRIDRDKLVVEVADNGRGIPEDEQEKVFEFAYSTREGGSGLGLAMVHQCIVEEHGGTVSMDSTPDKGTIVRLSLPIRPIERSATPGKFRKREDLVSGAGQPALRGRLLVVDDEEPQRLMLSNILGRAGFDVVTAADGADALERLEPGAFDLLLTDQRMPKIDGLQLLERAQRIDSTLPIVLMTAFGTVSTAVEAMKRGAADYLTKPFERDELLVVVEKSIRQGRLEAEVASLRGVLKERYRLDNIIGSGDTMQQVFSLIERVSCTDVPVLITGESGTGKELVARAIHERSNRAGQAFVALNCAAVPESLLESEFFGHERGAFTGAIRAHPGRFEQADGGTLFLDEIGAMRVDLQAKLLRALQEHEVQRLGATRTRKVDVRILAATGEDLERAISERRFREDLFYRLNVVPVALPPLRDRAEDIPLLVDHFVAASAKKLGRDPLRISPDTLEHLQRHSWPGNVRELENCVERLVVLARGSRITPEDLPVKLRTGPEAGGGGNGFELPAEGVCLADLERNLIEQALKRSRGSFGHAAKLLGISYKTLQYRVRKYELGPQRD